MSVGSFLQRQVNHSTIAVLPIVLAARTDFAGQWRLETLQQGMWEGVEERVWVSPCGRDVAKQPVLVQIKLEKEARVL